MYRYVAKVTIWLRGCERHNKKGGYTMKYISVVVPEEVDRELRFACADQATTKSRLVRKLIEEYLDEWKKEFEVDLQFPRDKEED